MLEAGPPLIYDYKEAPPALRHERSMRPSVGYAQEELNIFLRHLDQTLLTRRNSELPGDVARAKAFRAQMTPAFLNVDCWFGDQTELATKAFQAAMGLTPDGKIGTATWPDLAYFGNLPEFLQRGVDTETATPPPQSPDELASREPSLGIVGAGSRKGAASSTPPGPFLPHDAIQGRTWVDPHWPNGIIGQVFFETASATLDSRDMTQLDKIVSAFIPYFNAPGTPPAVFRYYGFADPRHLHERGGNKALSQARSDTVMRYVNDRLVNKAAATPSEVRSRFPKYEFESKGWGVHPGYIAPGQSARALRIYRRVDIFAPPANLPKPRPTPVPSGKLSSSFIVIPLGGFSVGYYVGVDQFDLVIKDVTNRRVGIFQYGGLALSASDSPVSFSDKGAPIKVKTTVPIELEDFLGFAVHLQEGAALGWGISHEDVFMLGPTVAGAAEVHIFFTGYTKEVVSGLSASFGSLSLPRPIHRY